MTTAPRFYCNFSNKTQRKQCRELLQDVWTGLIRQSETDGKEEFAALKALSLSDGDDTAPSNADIFIIPPSCAAIGSNPRIRSTPVPTIIVLPDDGLWDENTNKILMNPSCDVRGLFRAGKLLDKEKRDPEDYGAFAAIVKDLMRQFLRSQGEKKEEDFSKSIDWKARVPSNLSSGYVSLFSDPATQQMVRRFKEALNGFDRAELKALNSEFTNGRYRPNDETSGSDNKNFDYERRLIAEHIAGAACHVPSLLLLGETGCGKSLLASIVSRELGREDNYARLNIASAVKENVNVELFGSVHGSYTGSQGKTPGIFIAHCGGVVFLDEIGDMDASCQTRLLTYMDDGNVFPMGESRPVLAPCILIAATNRDIDDSRSGFRQDILHRFDHIIRIPSLRERKQDLRLLISLTLQNPRINPPEEPQTASEERRVNRISMDAIRFLEDYRFPGNFRELEFILRQAVNKAYAERNRCICFRHIADCLISKNMRG